MSGNPKVKAQNPKVVLNFELWILNFFLHLSWINVLTFPASGQTQKGKTHQKKPGRKISQG
jgi:hypothetical protein